MKRKIKRFTHKYRSKLKSFKFSKVHLLISVFAIIMLAFVIAITVIVNTAPKFEAKVAHVQIPRAQIAYYTRGTGEPIILIPGFGMTMQDWDPEFLQQLSRRNQLIIFDYRGVGASSGSAEKITQKQMTKDVVELMDRLHIRRAHVIGWSMGSFVAENLAEQYPDRVNGLVLLATNPGGDQSIPATDAVQKHVEQNLDGSWEKVYVPLLFSSSSAADAYIDRIEKARTDKVAPTTPIANYTSKSSHQLAFADAKSEKERYDALPSIQSRTLIISGSEDKLIPAENAKLTAAQIPNSELHIIEGAGHAVMFEKNKEVTDLIRSFVE